MQSHKTISFTLNGMLFEYDEEKNRANIKKHGVSFRTAARVFFDYVYDENSYDEDRYDVIGDTSAGIPDDGDTAIIGNLDRFAGEVNDILYVVYTERKTVEINGSEQPVTRIFPARLATNFERGFTMVNRDNLTKEQLAELAFSPEELAELKAAQSMPISFDEDCPETTPERALKFRRVNPPRNETRYA